MNESYFQLKIPANDNKEQRRGMDPLLKLYLQYCVVALFASLLVIAGIISVGKNG